MPFINPYQYGGGVKFNVHAVHELPTSAKSDDIYLVFAAGTPLPDVSNIKTVALFAKFVVFQVPARHQLYKTG